MPSSRTLILSTSLLAAVAVGALILAPRKDDPQRHIDDLWPMGDVSDFEQLPSRDDVNVLFILVDTLRADRMGVYGYHRDTTPRVARYAQYGVRFGRHLAQSSWTKASMASLWTGYYPTRTGIIGFDDVIPDEASMPAELLREAGFNTVGLWRNGWVAPTFGFAQGFDVYTNPLRLAVGAEARRENPTIKTRGSDHDVVTAALEFLKIEGRRSRWMLYLHLMDVHEYTYDEASAVFGTGYSDIYDNAILWTDETIDILLSAMLEQGYLKNTIVVLTSDHGEAFRERGHEGHARYVYRETTEIPFIVLFPFRLEPSRRAIPTRSQGVDVWPTVLELLGLAFPGDPKSMDGRSLRPDMLAFLDGPESSSAPTTERIGFAHLIQGWGAQTARRPTYSITSGSHRYVRRESGDAIVEELFDAALDPRELVDHAESRPDVLVELREAANALAEIRPVWGDPEHRGLTELELNQLRALGYKLP